MLKTIVHGEEETLIQRFTHQLACATILDSQTTRKMKNKDTQQGSNAYVESISKDDEADKGVEVNEDVHEQCRHQQLLHVDCDRLQDGLECVRQQRYNLMTRTNERLHTHLQRLISGDDVQEMERKEERVGESARPRERDECKVVQHLRACDEEVHIAQSLHWAKVQWDWDNLPVRVSFGNAEHAARRTEMVKQKGK